MFPEKNFEICYYKYYLKPITICVPNFPQPKKN